MTENSIDYKLTEKENNLVNFEIKHTIYPLVNIYVPNKEREYDIFFSKQTSSSINVNTIGNLILAGYMSHTLDPER